MFFFFFFSSRRRHTRLQGDWSSDVCSSDLESGDMKYVILKLLKDKPRHGYEVMKELEDQLRGCYSPSPGTVYPTLQWLEDEGLVTSHEVQGDRKSTRLNSSHLVISYAVFCLKKKKKKH